MISKCVPGASLDKIHTESFLHMQRSISELLGRNVGTVEMSQLYPHHVGHFLGLDVHDTPTIRRSEPFLPGMVVTIEVSIILLITYSPEYTSLIQKSIHVN